MSENELLKEAERAIKYFNKWDDADMGQCAYNAASELVEYCKQLERRVQELEKQIKSKP